jgi:hypothetical protein
MALSEDVHELAKGRDLATFTTMLPSGHPGTQVMWVDACAQRDFGRPHDPDIITSERVMLRIEPLAGVAS